MLKYTVSKTGYTAKQAEILRALKSKQAYETIGSILLKATTKYVPIEHGGLRDSGHVKGQLIVWDAEYAHYQYTGVVYASNRLGWIGEELGWRSPPGKGTKYPTGRQLGQFRSAFIKPRFGKGPHTPQLVYFGYSEYGVTSHWFDRMWHNDSRSVNSKITYELRQLVAKKGRK